MSIILQKFENIVNAHPHKKAVEIKNQYINYHDLATTAKSIGAAICGMNVSMKPIGVITDRTIEPLIGFLGTLYSNNFYVPIDFEMPPEKMRYIIEDSDLSIILCNRDYDDILRKANYSGRILHYDEIKKDECDVPADNNLLYLIYTSGSTGKPKGVLKTQSAEIDFIEAYWSEMGFLESDIIGNQTPFFFDAAAKDIYLMLCKGITMVIIPTEYFSLPPELIDYITEKKVTIASWVPTVLSLVAQLNPFSLYKPSTLRKVLFVGEVMPMKHLNVWRKELPEITYVNLYGQTEIAGICSYYVVEGEFDNSAVLPIGKPLKNSKIYLIDNDSVVAEPNHVGEIYIESKALADCYWNDAEMTKKSFLFMDFGNGSVRCFKTGDMGSVDVNGNLLFAERKDNQIKHMGYRIELGEIEAVAGSLQDIDRCCCIYSHDKRKIIMFCQLIPGSCKTGREIRSELKHLLSNYMVPGKVIIKDKLPLNRNGKIDRQVLKKELQGDK